METVNLQSVVKGNIPKPSPVAVSPGNTTESDVSLNSVGTQVAGNVVPPVQVSITDALQQRDKVEQTVNKLNSFVQNIQRGIQFSVQEETGRSIITITDTETGEEIRRIPSDQALAIAAHISETLAVPEEARLGLLVNDKA
jgi:flagellar protein FlaG